MFALILSLILHTRVYVGSGWQGVVYTPRPGVCVGWDAREGGVFGTPLGSGDNCS